MNQRNSRKIFNVRKLWIMLIPSAINIAACVYLFVSTANSGYTSCSVAGNFLTFLLLINGMVIAAGLYFAFPGHRRFITESVYIRRLNYLKDFFNSLHNASTEKEIYEILFEFLRTNPLIDGTSIYYSTDMPKESGTYYKLSNMDIPLCNMRHETCPALVSAGEYHAENVKIPNARCPYQSQEYKTGSYICIPISLFDSSKILIQLYSNRKHAFVPAFSVEIKLYIDVAVTTLSLIRAMHSLNKKAVTDKLTKLYNRNFLEPYLENQIEAANLSNQQICVLMVDIDHFKAINDTYGHAVGDYVLSAFANIVQKCIRKTDLLARYGGDEFIVVLPSTSIETAEIIAERIRNEVANLAIPSYNGIKIPKISCSVGISAYPTLCDSSNNLITTSDFAMYKAKQAGRNSIRVYKREYAV